MLKPVEMTRIRRIRARITLLRQSICTLFRPMARSKVLDHLFLRLGVVLRTLLGVDEGLLARDTDVALPALRTEVGDKLAVLLGEVSAETAMRRESALLCE